HAGDHLLADDAVDGGKIVRHHVVESQGLHQRRELQWLAVAVVSPATVAQAPTWPGGRKGACLGLRGMLGGGLRPVKARCSGPCTGSRRCVQSRTLNFSWAISLPYAIARVSLPAPSSHASS